MLADVVILVIRVGKRDCRVKVCLPVTHDDGRSAVAMTIAAAVVSVVGVARAREGAKHKREREGNCTALHDRR